MIERTFIKKNYNRLELENYLSKKLDRAGFSHLEIIKTPLVTRIVLHVAKPGLAIGKSGSTIKELTEVIATKFKIDNPQIEIQEIKVPILNAKITVEKMASMINRGYSWRSVSFRTVKDIMSAGAQGVELVFKGAIGGKGQRKRKQRIAIGYMKKIGDQSKFVDSAQAPSNPKCGTIGIKLSIIHPNVIFPDKIDVNKVIENLNAIKAQAIEQEKANEETENMTKDTETEIKDLKQNEKTGEVKPVEKKPIKKDEQKNEILKKSEEKVENLKEKKEDVEKIKENVEKKIEPKKEENIKETITKKVEEKKVIIKEEEKPVKEKKE